MQAPVPNNIGLVHLPALMPPEGQTGTCQQELPRWLLLSHSTTVQPCLCKLVLARCATLAVVCLAYTVTQGESCAKAVRLLHNKCMDNEQTPCGGYGVWQG